MKDSTYRKRVGIFRGSFDPIHSGHITFAIKAISEARLDCVYFLPENNPSHKMTLSNYDHRITLISQIISEYSNLHLLILTNMNGSIVEVLPYIRKNLGNAQLVFLIGSDIAYTLPMWPDLNTLLNNNEIVVVGMRDKNREEDIKRVLNNLPYKANYKVINVPLPDLSSSLIRTQKAKS